MVTEQLNDHKKRRVTKKVSFNHKIIKGLLVDFSPTDFLSNIS